MYNLIDNMAYFWGVIAIFFLILEMGNPGLFFFLSFFCGGLGATTATFFVESIIMQTVVFFVTTVCSLVLLRYYVMPHVGKDHSHERTNVYALQGKRGFVVHTITSQTPGLVRVNGEKWAARSVRGSTIEQGVQVEVVDIRGAHVIVKDVN
jgi:membrane protein implicated in regulation of membrane protease activity